MDGSFVQGIEEVYRLALPAPFSIGSVNCYLFRRNGLTLLDPGPDTDIAYEKLVTGLNEINHELCDVSRVLLTHPHIDHYGIANRIKEESGASIIAHENAAYRLQHPLEYFRRERGILELFSTLWVFRSVSLILSQHSLNPTGTIRPRYPSIGK